jgi:hypothetical protein
LASRDWGLLFLDGWLAVARVDPYRVDWRRPDGEWITGEPLPFRKIRVDEEQKCAALQPMLGERTPCDPSVIPWWPESVPPFVKKFPLVLLGPTPDGQLFIRRTPKIDDSGIRYDIVDREGRLAGVLPLPDGVRLIGSGARSIYTLVIGPEGLQTLRRHPWVGPGR